MKINNKIIILAMLVMMIACVSAVSATDIESSDNVTDVIEVDEVTDVVEEDVIDDVSEDVVEEDETNPVEDGTINGYTYNYFFHPETGELATNVDLNFTGNFYAKDFGNFKIGKSITINATGAIFHNIGFDLIGSQITLNGGTFIFDEPTNITAGLNVTGNQGKIYNTIIDVKAPENIDFYAIDVENSNNAEIINNTITYNCTYNNTASYNYVIKANKSDEIKIRNNTIVAYLPLKNVNWAISGSIAADYVAGVAIESCNNPYFTGNELNVTGTIRAGNFPTLDAFIIAKCSGAHVEQNTINEKDTVTVNNEYSYIYGIDVYSCNNIIVAYNDVTMNGNKSGGHIEGNGTGAAYCIQLSGDHQGVNIYYNNLVTSNEGPNLGIYSQNYAELDNHLTIYGNNITVTGKAGNDPWSLVSGIETQDRYAEIYNNTIRVNNTAGYASGNYAFGISYAQWINGTHYYNIHNNDVEVINGDYAVYLIDENVVTGKVIDNDLVAYTNNSTKTGDAAVSANGDYVSIDN